MSGGSSGLNKREGDYYPPLEERFIFTTTNYGGAKQPALVKLFKIYNYTTN